MPLNHRCPLLSHLFHRLRDRQRGQSLVELALVLPILLALLAGALDLGRVFYATVSLNNAAREGALQAAETPTSYVEDGACDTATNRVVCRVLLEAKDTMTTVRPTDIDVTCTVQLPSPCPKQAASLVTVEVRGTFTLLTPLLRSVLGTDTLNLRSTASAQINYLPPEAVAVPSPSASESASASPSPSCTPVPNVIGMSPTDAAIALDAAGFLGTGIGDLTTGPKMKVQAQSIDSSQCREAFANPRLEVIFQYRPLN